MARTSDKGGNLSRRATDKGRSRKGGKDKTRLGTKGYGRPLQDKLRENEAIGNVVPGNAEESNAGTTRDNGIGIAHDLAQLEANRAKIYGDPYLSHQAIGMAVEGVFRNRYHEISEWLNKEYPHLIGRLFPASLMANVFAGFKIVRLARPVFHKDSGDDAKVYTDFTMRFHGK